MFRRCEIDREKTHGRNGAAINRAVIETLEGRQLFATQAPFLGSPFAVGSTPVTIQAEHYDRGGQGVSYSDTTSSNTGGTYRTGTDAGVDIKTITNTTNQYRITDAYAGEWVEYTINVQQAGDYKLELQLGNPNPNGKVHVEIDGNNVTGFVTVPDTNDFSKFSTVSRTVTLAAGQHVMRLAFDAGAGGSTALVAVVDWMRFTRVGGSTGGGSTTVPSTPTNPSATVVSPTQVRLAWSDNSSNESGFRIERSDNGGAWSQVAQVGANVKLWTDTTQGGHTYLYRVRSYNGAGASAASSTAVAVTPIGAGWKPLFNGYNLNGWDTYLPTTGKVTNPSVSSTGMFSVHDGMLHILNIPSTNSNVPFGYLATESNYGTYHLTLEYKWGTKKFAPRLGEKRDSGLLYHIGSSDAVWPRGMEVQIQEGDTGDVWMLAGATASTTVASTSANIKQFKEGGTAYRFAGGGDVYSRLQKSTTAESLTGWNKAELYVTGDEAAVIVNGKLVNRVYDMRVPDGSSWKNLLLGRIGLQAEGAEVFYRNVQVRPLGFDAAPSGATKLFSGGSTSAWRSVDTGGAIGWDVKDGELVVDPGTGDIRTNSTYRDFNLHVEFSVPFVSTSTEQNRGNSGIYLQGRYEVQILDSFNRTLADNNDLGAIYGQRNASANAALPAELWQSYDISFTAARWSNGTKTSDARVTVVLNGITIQNNVALPTGTAFGSPEGSSDGPIVLQDHDNLVRFRNIWIQPR
jgi:hypothetical protein